MKKLEEIMNKERKMLNSKVNYNIIELMGGKMPFQLRSISLIYNLYMLKGRQFDNKL
jgi:hypothetical protein